MQLAAGALYRLFRIFLGYRQHDDFEARRAELGSHARGYLAIDVATAHALQEQDTVPVFGERARSY